MNPAAAPQRSKAASAAGPDGTPVPPAGGASGQARGGRWAAAVATYAPAVIPATTMVILGWWGLARNSSMGNDEVVTRWAALLGLRQLAHLLSNVDAVHGLYYLLMHFWMVVGTSPAVMRIPSVIAMTVAAVLMVIIARRLTGSAWAALFAGMIMVLTPAITFYAQTARSYAMVFACVLGSTLALMNALAAEAAGATSTRRRWLIYGALVTLGGYLNEMSLLVLAAHAITVLLARPARPAVERWAATSVVAGALVVPLLVVSLVEHAAVGWIIPPQVADLLVLYHDYFGASIVLPVLVAVCVIAAVLPPLGRKRPGGTAGQPAAEPEPAWWRSGGVSAASVGLPLLVVPASLLLSESYLTHPLYVDRYVLYGEAGAALLAGAGVYRVGRWLASVASRRALIWGPGAVLCVCALVLQLGAQHNVRTPGSRRYDYGGPSRYVGAHARPGDGVLFFGVFYRKARLGYPADFRKTSDFALAVPLVRAGSFRGHDKPFGVTRQLMLERRRIWVLGVHPSAHLPSALDREESMVLKRDFILVTNHRFHGMDLTLWVRR